MVKNYFTNIDQLSNFSTSRLVKIEIQLKISVFFQPVPVAQWIARWTSNPKVAGSNPAGDKDLLNFNFLGIKVLQKIK